MAARVRTPFYREFLTPALHRRFTGAAGIAVLICYVSAVLIGEKSSLLWWWFPLGRAGVRTLLLSISSLAVFVLRVAQLHLEARNTVSPFDTFRKYLFRVNTVRTFGWYLFSAWWFSEIYLWSAADGANLGWLSEGNPWERKRLNERPIYLRSVYIMLAFLQTFIHLCYDYDRVYLSGYKKSASTQQRSVMMLSPITQLKILAPSLIQRVIVRSGLVSLLGPFAYALFIRRTAWSWTLALARMLWDMPAAAELSYIPPYHISLIVRCMSSSFLLILLWESSNTIFSAYVAQEPLKNDAPLTNESKDPNGSLLNGLESNKDLVKTFAFWELANITQRFEARRKNIFSDIDRASGPAWSQILSAGLSTIQGVATRIGEFQNPSLTNPTLPQQAKLQSLPRLSAPLKQDPVLNNPLPPSTRLQKIESDVGNMAKSYGQSSPRPFGLSPGAKKYLGAARNKLLTEAQQESISPANITSVLNDYLIRFIRSPLGAPFRQTFRRRVCVVVLGSPYSKFCQIFDAIDILSRLAIASLKEDNFGKVHSDIPLLIRTYASTISTLEAFVASTAVHWTDVEFRDRKVEEVDILLACLKEGLRALVESFGSYADVLGINQKELKDATALAGSNMKYE